MFHSNEPLTYRLKCTDYCNNEKEEQDNAKVNRAEISVEKEYL